MTTEKIAHVASPNANLLLKFLEACMAFHVASYRYDLPAEVEELRDKLAERVVECKDLFHTLTEGQLLH